jgi:hypothetical protein
MNLKGKTVFSSLANKVCTSIAFKLNHKLNETFVETIIFSS